jgi:hypothetical protein
VIRRVRRRGQGVPGIDDAPPPTRPTNHGAKVHRGGERFVQREVAHGHQGFQRDEFGAVDPGARGRGDPLAGHLGDVLRRQSQPAPADASALWSCHVGRHRDRDRVIVDVQADARRQWEPPYPGGGNIGEDGGRWRGENRSGPHRPLRVGSGCRNPHPA